MKNLVNLIASTVLSFSITSCAANGSPEQLAKSLQNVLDNGDIDAAIRLADLSGSPAMVQSMFLDSVIECSGDLDCKVGLAPVDDAFRQGMGEQAHELGIEEPTAEGLLVVESKSSDGTVSGSFKLPYTKVDGDYRIASARYTASHLASLRARSNESLLQEMFARGVTNPATGASRKDWATAATRLPEDGGPVGRSLVERTSAVYKAVQAKDPDAAIRVGDALTAMLLAKTGDDGKPVPMSARQRQLRVMSMTDLHDVKVVEGYSLDDLVVLVIEARDGIDWIVRGAVLMTKYGKGWEIAGHNYVEYPAGN